jgi:hypothetical protein
MVRRLLVDGRRIPVVEVSFPTGCRDGGIVELRLENLFESTRLLVAFSDGGENGPWWPSRVGLDRPRFQVDSRSTNIRDSTSLIK